MNNRLYRSRTDQMIGGVCGGLAEYLKIDSTLIRLFFVLLIAIGLDILVGQHSRLGSLIVALLLVGVLAAAIGWGLPAFGSNAGLAAQVERTETIAEDLKGASRAEIEIQFGTGTLYLAALPEGSTLLLSGTVDLSRGEDLH